MKKNQAKRIEHAAMVADRVIAVQERRRSGAAGSHDTRPKSERTRAASKRAALADYR